MFSSTKKPYSAVTVHIDRLTSEQFEDDDISGIIDLVEVIRIQESGPTEAARAIRKKLKYGSPHRQIRALVILDGLMQNVGSRFQRAFADEPLLERLRILARDETVDKRVREKCKVLFVQWANAYKGTPGLELIADLYKQFPRTKKPDVARQKVLDESDPFESPEEIRAAQAAQAAQSSPRVAQPPVISPAHARIGGAHSSASETAAKKSKDRRPTSGKPFNLAREKENMTKAIAMSSMASTNLLNGLQLVNRESERISENKEVVQRFDACKSLRRQILYYIQQVESDEWIGSLVNANDDLVKALTAYEIMDRSISDDSDSDAWADAAGPHRKANHDSKNAAKGGLFQAKKSDTPPAKPPRPAPSAVPTSHSPDLRVDQEDEDDPFGDSNEVHTPFNENSGPVWREV